MSTFEILLRRCNNNLFNLALLLGIIMVFVSIMVFFYFKKLISYNNTQESNMPLKNSKPYKVVAFDLDETLGCFVELSIFWNALESFYGHNLFNDSFFDILKIFPEFFRPNIFNIIDYIHKKKLNKQCNKIIIYTNNQGAKDWVKMISEYFDYKLGYKVFDNIIAAYKINGKQIEPNRTSHEKSVTDLIRCTDIPADSEICFIDDLYHNLMDKDNVMYIQVKPYHFSLSYADMATRYYQLVLNKNNKATINEDNFVTFIVSHMQEYNYRVINKSSLEEKTDRIVSKKLLSHLEDFLKHDRLSNTRKKRERRIKTMRKNI
jgi:hypothetical protein